MIKNFEVFLEKWQHIILNYIPKVAFALLVLIAFYFIGKLAKKSSFKFYSRILKKQPGVVRIISTVIFFFFLLFGVFSALEILDLEGIMTTLLTSAGIVGIVAGFAFKDIVSNIFAGLLLRVQQPFKGGDWVNLEGGFGTIKELGWITTSIETVKGEEFFVPNQLIYNNTFINYSTFGKRRIVFKSGVSYGDDLDLVKKVTLEEVDKIDSVLKNEVIDFYFTHIGSSSYNFEVRFWIKFEHQKDYLSAMNEIIMRIQRRFAKENISLAYNVTTLDFGGKGGVNLFDKPINIETVKRD